ncbi:hypothetical protein [Streptomyces afghaniensis]|uniref:hypothetical protein n=1 Tax=Streptomyces afghaniensis TaxID=66865 RepID=UPI002789D546|nr:hypothetical protein [Streptomyces afghaniensis]MDQ1016114.1 hypothetical protein [Streptomyces afghaniensis]
MALVSKDGRPAAEAAKAALAHPRVVLAEDRPGTDDVVAIVVTEERADLPAAVADVHASAR